MQVPTITAAFEDVLGKTVDLVYVGTQGVKVSDAALLISAASQ